MNSINIAFPEIGQIRPRSCHEIADSGFTLGCETLDRDYADYEQYKDYLEPLGIKNIRLQAGWAKTESAPGIYHFEWLDRIIHDAVGRGLNILLETDYGNAIYPGGGGVDLAGGFPSSDEALAAWERWVATMAQRYAGLVRDWAMWNEPDDAPGSTPESIIDFNVRTAEIIRKYIPAARIAGLSLAYGSEWFEYYIRRLHQLGKLELFEWIIYHGYKFNPDEGYDNGCRLKKILNRYSTKVKLRQGENGCPSEYTDKFAIGMYPWSELSQAKWNLRRFIGDIANQVETAVFTICDFNHIGRTINRKGLLYANEKHQVLHRKMAYYAIQNMTAIFDYSLQPVLTRGGIIYQHNCAGFQFQGSAPSGALFAYWDRSGIPDDNCTPGKAQLVFDRPIFSKPVLVEMISGRVFEIPKQQISQAGTLLHFRDMPVIDSPLLIADQDLLSLK